MRDFDIDFSLLFDDNIIATKSNGESSKQMFLYAYVDNNTAKELFQYYARKMIYPDIIEEYHNPIQLPITLYEYPEIAKVLAPKSNTVLARFDVDISIEQIYDRFNPFTKLKSTDINIFIIREKDKYNSKEYIKYTIKNNKVIKNIQMKRRTEHQ